MHFSRQLGVFVKAGIPIMEALEVIAEETTDKLLKQGPLRDDRPAAGRRHLCLGGGRAPGGVPRLLPRHPRSAELTGKLDTVLDQLADYIERDIDARGKVTSALIYPAVVAVWPSWSSSSSPPSCCRAFEIFFKSLHAKLPLPTRMLLSVSGFVSSWWFALVGGLILVVAGFIAMRRSTAGRARLDAVILKLPVLGDLVQAAVLERICRILSSMIRAGVALPEAMTVTADSANNAVYRQGVLRHP